MQQYIDTGAQALDEAFARARTEEMDRVLLKAIPPAHTDRPGTAPPCIEITTGAGSTSKAV